MSALTEKLVRLRDRHREYAARLALPSRNDCDALAEAINALTADSDDVVVRMPRLVAEALYALSWQAEHRFDARPMATWDTAREGAEALRVALGVEVNHDVDDDACQRRQDATGDA